MCNPDSPIGFFRAKLQDTPSRQTRANLTAAVNALSAFVGDAALGFDGFTHSLIGEWVSAMLFQGYSPKTISNNVLKRIATLYNKAVEEALAEPTSVFKDHIKKLNEDGTDATTAADCPKTFNKLQDLVRRDYSPAPRKQLAKDIVLFSIYMGGMSFEEIAGYGKDDYHGQSEAIREIIERYSKPKNKYLFPLNRIHSTPKKINRSIQCMFAEALEDCGLKLTTNPSDTSFHLWACAAMSCGISASDVAACIAPKNKDLHITAYATPSVLCHDQIMEIRHRVESTLNHNPVRWYAMHLRPRVEIDRLIDRLKERNAMPSEIYYPMQEVYRKVGKRKIFETQPVIAWLVFFRSRVTQLNALFREIGDLAWGYRQIPDYKSPYAVIPDREIRHYQMCIGTLSPSTKMLSDEEIHFNEGDHLVILGGMLDGYHAVFISEKTYNEGKPGSKVVYRLRLTGGTNANWIVEHDPSLVQKLPSPHHPHP